MHLLLDLQFGYYLIGKQSSFIFDWIFDWTVP